MTTVTPPHWGERSYLYDKSLSYVFSLDIAYKLVDLPEAAGLNARIPLRGYPPDVTQFSTYRVLPSEQFDSPENIKRDVPRGRVASARDSLTLTLEGAVPLDGRVLIETEASEPIVLTYTGVLNLAGGTARLMQKDRKEANGTAFIACQQEVSTPRYKWLVYNQLIGMGRVKARPPIGEHLRWLITMSFDLYLGS